MKTVVIAGYIRSPFTLAYKGALAKVRPDELAAQVVKGLMVKTGVNPELIEDLILGCAYPEAEQGFNMGRLVTFLADLPRTVAGTTVNRFCGSSMQSIHMAAGAIQMNAGEAFICAGVESMSRVPMVGFNPMPHPRLYKEYPQAYMGMGDTAENLVEKYKISREEQDSFAVESHKKAANAMTAGFFKDEIIPIDSGQEMVEEDGCIRPQTDMATLAGLKPAFNENGSVTAGTSSPLTDGASATLVCTEEFAEQHKLDIVAKIKSFAVSGCLPEIMGIGPVESSNKALKRAGLKIEDMDVIELNEAFASQSLAVLHDLKPDLNVVNIDGGAIALGHPLGATGARITGKAAALLSRTEGKYALATQCIGGGQGIATVLERA
jgi:acetyl-CoA acyltransferase